MKRIKYYNTLIEKLIILLPFLFSLLIFVCLERAYPLIISLLRENDIDNSNIIPILIDIGIFIISCLPLMFSFFKSFSKRTKAMLYRGMLRIYLLCHNRWIALLCSKVINIFFKVKKLEIREQNLIVEKLLALLDCSDNTQKLAFLTGSAYSGKTTTMLMFLEELILNRNYASLYNKLEHKIYYYDFDSQFSFKNFNNDYVLSKYDSSLLIIDNLHRESEEQFIQLIDLILSAGNKAYGVFVVFRKPEEFLINQTKAMNLYNSISNYCINVDCSSKAISLINDNKTMTICADMVKFQSFLIHLGFADDNLKNNPVMYIHLYKIFEYYTKFFDQKVFEVFHVLLGVHTNTIMKDALITILMLCQHVGKFVKKDYYYTMKELKHGHISSTRAIETLLSINFIEPGWYEINSSQFLLHEELARIYLQYILQESINHDTVISLSKILFNKFQNTNMLLAWYYSLLCRTDIKYDKYMFDRVLDQANVKNMLTIMKFYWNYADKKSYTLCREYGILHRIAGNEDTSRKYLLQSYELYPIPETLLELFEVKHKYYLKWKKNIKKITDNANPYVRLGISYWNKHIDMHLGIFNFQSCTNDANLILENEQWILDHEPYEGYHLLKRWYFDYFKIFFLSGILNYDKINQNENTVLYNIRSLLFRKSAEISHYNQVYVLADYVQYTIMFNHRIEGIYPSKAELDFINLNSDEYYVATSGQLQNYAAKLYENAIKIMKKNGDNAYWHVINRKIDLLLQNDKCDFDEIEAKLECYMQHAFEIQCYEYMAYAHMFLLKMKLIRQLIFAHEDDKNDQIKKHMTDFRKYYRMHNSFRENIYAEIRLKLFEALFAYQCRHLLSIEFRDIIDSIQRVCEKQNYQRELSVIRWIKKRDYRLSPGELKFLYQSYPIIIQ